MLRISSIKRFIKPVFLLLFLVLISCSVTHKKIREEDAEIDRKNELEYVTPWEAKLDNVAHYNFAQGEKFGIIKGHELGFKDGREFGYKEGFEAQSSALRRKLTDCERAFNAPGTGGNLIEETRQNAYAHGQEVGAKSGYNLGYREGLNIGYDKGVRVGYDSGYKVQLGLIVSDPEKQIRLTAADFNSVIDYEALIDQISRINGHKDNDIQIYSEVLNEVHKEILEFVSRKVDLNENEKQDLFKEYTRIHNQIVQSYYKQFQDLYFARNIASKNSIEYFTEYNNVELFSEVLSSGICMLVDVTITFAKSNPLYGERAGIFLGKLCEVLLNNVIKNISDSLFKIALFREYNKLSIELKEKSAKMIGELAVTEFETVQELTKEKSFLFSKAKVDLRLKTVLKLGFILDEFKLELDHKKQLFNITLSDKPKVLTINQVPKYLNIETGFFVSINESDLQEMYIKAEEQTIKEAMFAGLDELSKNKAESILKTVFYPLIALPHSQYKVIVKFGQNEGHLLFSYNK